MAEEASLPAFTREDGVDKLTRLRARYPVVSSLTHRVHQHAYCVANGRRRWVEIEWNVQFRIHRVEQEVEDRGNAVKPIRSTCPSRGTETFAEKGQKERVLEFGGE